MRKLLLGLCLALTGIQISLAQSATDQEIIKLSKDKWQWMADKNVAPLDSLFHEKSMFAHMGGSWGKQRELEVIRIDLLAVVGGNEATCLLQEIDNP